MTDTIADKSAFTIISEQRLAEVERDPERIWLQNANDARYEGRQWCEDKVWTIESGEGEPTEYIRADIAEATLRSARKEIASADKAIMALFDRHGWASGHGDTLADLVGELSRSLNDCLDEAAHSVSILKARVTELEGALKGCRCDQGPHVRSARVCPECEDTYSAGPPAPQSVEGFNVRKLEWHKSHIKPWNGDYHSIPTNYTIRCADENGWKWSRAGGFGYCPSPEAAKAAAQRDHEMQILAAIDITPQPASDSALREALAKDLEEVNHATNDRFLAGYRAGICQALHRLDKQGGR